MAAAAPNNVTSIATASPPASEDEVVTTGSKGKSGIRSKIDMAFLKGRIKDMTEDRGTYMSHWKDIGDYIMPRRAHHLRRKKADGGKYNQKILNTKATRSVRRAVAGFQSGMTPRTRPWFVFEPDQKAEGEDEFEIKRWGNEARRIVFSIMQRSNFYQSTQICYSDFVPFGVGCIQIDEIPGPTMIQTRVHPIGSYLIDVNEEGTVDTFAREYRWSLKKIIDKFGKEALPPALLSESKISIGTKQNVWNMIYPNKDYTAGALGPIGKLFMSVWWIDGYEDSPGPIRIGGYEEFPLMVPRFWKVGDEAWAQSPGMDALPDVKSLQKECSLKLQGLEKTVWPPMKGPGSMAKQAPSQLPGSFVAVKDGAELLQSQYDVRIDLTAIYNDIALLEAAIADTFFENIFTAIMDTARRQRTLGEVEKIESEKFMMLGPVLENLIDDLLEPAVSRIFAIAARRGEIPDPPISIDGKPIKITFVSILAQAQKALDAVGVEQTVSFVMNASEVFPEMRSRLDVDEAAEIFADAVGGQDVLVSRKDAEEARAAEAKAAAQAQQLEAASQAASAAKDASQASFEGDSALTRAANQFAGGQA